MERSHDPQTGEMRGSPVPARAAVFDISAVPLSCKMCLSKIHVTGTFIRAVQIIQEVVIPQPSGLYIFLFSFYRVLYFFQRSHTGRRVHGNTSLRGFLSRRSAKCSPLLEDEHINQPGPASLFMPLPPPRHILKGLCSPSSPTRRRRIAGAHLPAWP